ncbi:MAG: transcriptional regulator, partial [Leuconostoc citreum]|nr:transcriptional regulator [Leuconostoc citreum]
MAQNIIEQLRAQKKQYNSTENKLIDYILQDTVRAREATIRELSNGSGVSTATISRFAKKIGFDSFR